MWTATAISGSPNDDRGTDLGILTGTWTRWHRTNQCAIALFPAVLLPVCICLLGPWWLVYQFHPDEGVNLLKGALVANGFHLYDQIWSDQPPVLTLILAAVHLVFPYNVAVARAVILASASLLLWSLFRVVRRTDGALAAWIAVAVLGLSNLFLTLSVSVMIGLPAIALAMCAID